MVYHPAQTGYKEASRHKKTMLGYSIRSIPGHQENIIVIDSKVTTFLLKGLI